MKKTARSTKRTSSVLPSIPEQTPAFQPSAQTNNIMFILLAVVALFSVYLFLKVRNLEQKIAAGLTAQVASPLSADNLKKYAKDMRMNTGKFNKCLDSGEKKAAVDSDISAGTGIGVQGTPAFLINGRLLAGAFPFEFFKEVIDKEIEGKGSSNCNDYSENLRKYCQDPQNKPFDPEPKKFELGNAPSTGANNAKVNIVEFSDFQCPFCIRAYPTVKQIMETYKNDVRLYFKNYPLTQIHPLAQKAAEASMCADDQGKFWQYHDTLFNIQKLPGT